MLTRRRSSSVPLNARKRRNAAAKHLAQASAALLSGGTKPGDFEVGVALLVDMLHRMLSEPEPAPYDEAQVNLLLQSSRFSPLRNDLFPYAGVTLIEAVAARIHSARQASTKPELASLRGEAEYVLTRLVSYGMRSPQGEEREDLVASCARWLAACDPKRKTARGVLSPMGVLANIMAVGKHMPGSKATITDTIGQAVRRQQRKLKPGWSLNDWSSHDE